MAKNSSETFTSGALSEIATTAVDEDVLQLKKAMIRLGCKLIDDIIDKKIARPEEIIKSLVDIYAIVK